MAPELELVQQWLQKVWSDLLLGQAALDLPVPQTAGACFHCQQAVEKSLKAFLVFQAVEFEWSHKIEYLINLCVEQDQSFEQIRNSAAPLADYAVGFRYPANEPDPTLAQAREALAVAHKVYHFILDRLPPETHPEE